MVFNSFSFLVFFPLVTIIYFLLPHKFRWIHLLVSSCIFYMFFIPVYILILIFTIVIDYFAGILIDQAQGRRRKAFLLMSIVANVGVLAIFKYYNFFLGNMNWVADLFHIKLDIPYLNIILPIGLSFHTFQAMSYTIEVYRGNFKPVRDFGIYSLYVMFYPQLVAGPIERPQNLIHQFYEKHEFEYDRVVSGLKPIAWEHTSPTCSIFRTSTAENRSLFG
jgi:D-alanyl-lipoteichoic acid acyltransferase DltB (MBOAT superfamily)